MVTFVPMWVAPNLITIVGLLVNIVTSLNYVYHAPQAKEEVRYLTLLGLNDYKLKFIVLTQDHFSVYGVNI